VTQFVTSITVPEPPSCDISQINGGAEIARPDIARLVSVFE